MSYTHITVERSFQDKVATITMRRPEVHNAFNAQLIQDLHAAFTDLVSDEKLHAVVLTGDGPSFSAGADIGNMKEAAAFSQEQNLQDALKLADLFDTINTFPCPVVARVNGTAMGGGVGLIAVCDIVIAVESVRLAFSEVRLGIAPAVISPYVIRKIGETNARVLFVTGERFTAARGRTLHRRSRSRNRADPHRCSRRRARRRCRKNGARLAAWRASGAARVQSPGAERRKHGSRDRTAAYSRCDRDAARERRGAGRAASIPGKTRR